VVFAIGPVGDPDGGLPVSSPTGEAAPDYRLAAGFLQPHWQLFIWQRHAFFWHAQEQVSQSQLPQQLDLLTVFEVVLVKSDIVVLPYLFFSASCAFTGADVQLPETLQCSPLRGSLAV
jgi:hypothetical protein